MNVVPLNAKMNRLLSILVAFVQVVYGLCMLMWIAVALLVTAPFRSKYDRPVYRVPPIARQYFKCPKCCSLDGGIYGKGPVEHYRSPGAARCVHDWQEITRAQFEEEVSRRFANGQTPG